MRFGAKASDLASVELAYAPPYSSAKDPVNMLGYTADNIITEKVQTVQWHEVDALLENGAFFLDIRESFEQAAGLLPNTSSIPLNELRQRVDELPKDQTIYVYCQVGQRGYNAARVLMSHGFDVRNLDGGYKTYKQAKYELKNIALAAPTKEVPASVAAAVSNLAIVEVDARGLQCPGPILKVKQEIDRMENGQRLSIQVSDFGFSADIAAWCKNTGNTLVSTDIQGGQVVALITKGQAVATDQQLPDLSKVQEGVLHETKRWRNDGRL